MVRYSVSTEYSLKLDKHKNKIDDARNSTPYQTASSIHPSSQAKELRAMGNVISTPSTDPLGRFSPNDQNQPRRKTKWVLSTVSPIRPPTEAT